MEGVEIYGGFVGNETSRDQRNWRTNITTLSGDIGAAAGDYGGGQYNSYHVVTGKGLSSATVLDGFTISDGDASGAYDNGNGGGLYLDGAGSGNQCNPTLRNLIFIGNCASQSGGAIFNDGSNSGESSPMLINVSFIDNSGSNGGAMFNFSNVSGESSPKLINVSFINNEAVNGGAMCNTAAGGTSSPMLINVTFSGNATSSNPSGSYRGGAIFNSSQGGPCKPTLINVILWGNSTGRTSEMTNSNATPTISHSIVKGGVNSIPGVIDGGNNLDSDPLFVTPVDPATAPTTSGNLRLKAGSPAIDAGDPNAVPASVTTDLDGNPRMLNGKVDIGAHQHT